VIQEETVDTTAAEAYEKHILPAFMLPLVKGVIAAAAPRPGERVLDVACGTGLVARLVAPLIAPGGTMNSLDFDPAMIAVALRVVKCPPDTNMTWHCASALSMPYDDHVFDVVFCLHGLQFFPDHAAGLAEMHRVMKPRARLAVTVWSALDRCKGNHLVLKGLEHRGVDPTPVAKPFVLGDVDKLQTLAHDAGFREISVRAEPGHIRFPAARNFVEALATGSVAARLALSKLPDGQRASFMDEMAEQFRPFEEGGGVAVPCEQLVLAARAG
jgi:ubiquinone/menaquinone biosynthesis C-methylase UbiE